MAIWKIDPDHTVAAFHVGHMMVSLVHGQFNRLAGHVTYTPADPATLAAEITIAADSLTTGLAKRDLHLMSPDFLDVAQFPEIKFQSGAVRVTSINTALVQGRVTIRDVTLPVELEASLYGPLAGTEGETTIGVHATTRLDREAFGLTWNMPLENGGYVVGKMLYLNLEVEADLVA
ncbi:MAG: YceI family protein [Deltaproteobacteria bacterium]|nr:YceI family protein [Deltaproteobacteria bacterium]MCB2186300.1 YceI family protein [Deltaproteobacteria bacterium]